MVLTSVGHVVIELTLDGASAGGPTAGWAARLYNLTAILAWGGYVLWRLMKTPGTAFVWGFRRDNLVAAVSPCLLASVFAVAALFSYGSWMGRSALPALFWIVLLLYCFYGLAQQFALQMLIRKNLQELVRRQPLRILLASSLFGAAHFPEYRLMSLAFVAGLVWTWMYERYPNLWAVGISHGVLGALAYYWVLGLDPGTEVIEAVRRFPW